MYHHMALCKDLRLIFAGRKSPGTLSLNKSGSRLSHSDRTTRGSGHSKSVIIHGDVDAKCLACVLVVDQAKAST